jgi:hypothetical protein
VIRTCVSKVYLSWILGASKADKYIRGFSLKLLGISLVSVKSGQTFPRVQGRCSVQPPSAYLHFSSKQTTAHLWSWHHRTVGFSVFSRDSTSSAPASPSAFDPLSLASGVNTGLSRSLCVVGAASELGLGLAS